MTPAASSSIRIRLWFLVAATLLPLVLLSAASLFALARQQEAQLERALVERARAIASAVDLELQSSIAALTALALSSSLERGDLRAFHAQTQLAVKARPSWDGIILMDASGKRLLNSRVPFGSALPGGSEAVEPLSVARVLSGGAAVVGSVAKGPGGNWRFPIRVPVRRGGTLAYVLTAFAKPEAMLEIVQRQKVPVQSISTVFDGRRAIVARSRNHDDFLGSMLSESLRRLMGDAEESFGITSTREGDEVHTAFSRTASGGWGVALGVPRALLDAPLRRSYLLSGLGLLISLGLGGAAAAWLARRMISERTAQLQAANRALAGLNKELEAFSYSVSHDLRAPLRAIDGFSAIVLRDHGGALPAEGRRHLQVVSDSAKRMGKMVDDLLSFSRYSHQALARRRIDTHRLVERCVETAQRDFGRPDVACRIGELPACSGDEDLLAQVWLNLIGNAFKYTRRTPDPRIEIGCERRGGEDVFFVRDNGAGFEMAHAGRLFGVFQRLHRSDEFEGSGVGLAIVERIVSRHGGRIWAEAAPGKGAAFRFTLGDAPPGPAG